MGRVLDLGLESFVFLATNPAERKRVRYAFAGRCRSPRIAVLPAWISVIQVPTGLFEQTIFPARTSCARESKGQSGRPTARSASSSYDYLRSLDMTLSIAPRSPGRNDRAVVGESNHF